jgi:2-polyprenyl-3-methyl-5-hydroxy-6-metoxy-1,4-benzoquinol methylase
MKCYLCNSSEVEAVRTKLRGDVDRDTLHCKKCSLTYLAEKKFDTEEHYRTNYRDTYSPAVGKKQTSKEVFDMYIPFQQVRIDRIKHILRRDMRVLDIGASSGHFLYTLKDYVGERIALELNQKDGEFMMSELGLTVYDKPLEQTDLPKEHFDLITIFQTLEHVADPISFLKTVSNYLKPDGYLVVEVPNENEALYILYHSEAYADFNHKEPHLFYYTPETLKKILGKADFHGDTPSIQRVNFLNHLHWIFTGKPQSGPNIHMAPAKLVTDDNSKVSQELNIWIKKVDEEYRDILNKHNVGESILFIGQKQK